MNSKPKKVILHFDMDAFFANVEIRDNPKLQGKPVIIGSKPGNRGVVSTCSYEARKYGIHSAMSSNRAYDLCPNGIFIKPDMKKYNKVSQDIKKIVLEYSDIYEFLSLDEGYLDLTHTKQIFGGSEEVVYKIKNRIKRELNLTCSVGLGYNKMTAKLASEENKPDGFYKIKTPKQFCRVFKNRKISIIPGVGRVSYKKLQVENIFTVRDVWRYSKKELEQLFGNLGESLYYKSRGISDDKIGREIKNKSRGRETTYKEDIIDKKIIYDTLKDIIKELSFYLIENKKWCKTVTVKIKYKDMKQITRSKTVDTAIRETKEIYDVVDTILKKIRLVKKVRLSGMYISNFVDRKVEQMKLGEGLKTEKKEKISGLVYKIRKKYGQNIIIDPIDMKND
ncbi:MAG: DNA polymerase IV [Fusobacteriota bacterium]